MGRGGHVLCVLLNLVLITDSEAQGRYKKLSAPTYYLAAQASTTCDRDHITIRGATNLPPGSRINVIALELKRDSKDYRKPQSEAMQTNVRPDGLFDVRLKPKAGDFSEYVVVQVTFDASVNQPRSVSQVVGRKGEMLGDLDNPQLGIYSGTHAYLSQGLLVEFCGRTN
jgi:hypothetical protein